MTETRYSARDVAVSSLRDRAGNVTAHLNRLLGRCGLAPAEAALARELALGACRRKATLQAVMRAFLKHPNKRLPAPLTEIIHVALYQILFLDRIPAFAAVNEAVNQAVHYRHKRQSGLVNGVLRTVLRNVGEPVLMPPPLAGNVVPTGPASYRKVQRRVFSDPSAEPADYLAGAFSLPLLLAQRWVERFDGLEGAVEVATHANARAPLTLRVNALAATAEQVLSSLAAAGVGAQPHSNGLSVVLDDYCDVTRLDVFRDGWVQPQDAAATEVVVLAAPKPGMKVLDACAAPGTKTTHLTELMENRGSITAMDVSGKKRARIEDNCRRMGARIVETMPAERLDRLDAQSFDLVLADVPCSNTGVLARRAEARWRFDREALPALVKNQESIAAEAARFVSSGGKLVYSTCSIEPEECGQVARRLTDKEPRLQLVQEKLTLPAGANEPAKWHDGGYVAIFEAS